VSTCNPSPAGWRICNPAPVRPTSHRIFFRAADYLEHDTTTEHEIYVICDKQASSWRNLSDDLKRQWNNRGSPLPKLIIIPVGGDESDNVAVDSVEIPDHALIRNETAIVRLYVHNYGPDPWHRCQYRYGPAHDR